MVLRNPCKKCLVKVCCNKTCERKEEFEQLYDNYGVTIVISLLIINILAAIIIIIYILAFLDFTLYKRILILFGIWSIPFTIVVLHDIEGFKEEVKENFLLLIGLYISLPLIVIVAVVVSLIENIIGTGLL